MHQHVVLTIFHTQHICNRVWKTKEEEKFYLYLYHCSLIAGKGPKKYWGKTGTNLPEIVEQ